MKLKQPNSLNFYGIRRCKVPPPHFEYITIPLKYNLDVSISKWITDNLKGRFYVSSTTSIDNENRLSKMLKIGFEENKELSFFTLACPLLKY